ncbi:hypothetical protein M885DRAFT_329378 [Pelagophyceae sp. CCMP2097]|nr:hypothetical protein M885DRAFT_329378 [Pelagophyceae sp. CCMP2097]
MASAVDVASIDVDVASIDVLDASAREAEALNAPAPEDEPPEEAAAARGPESAAAAATAVEASASPPAAPTISFSDEGSSSSSGTEYTRVPEDGPGPLAHHWQLEAPTEFTSPAAPSSSSGMEPEAPPRAATPAGGRDEAPETPAQKPVDREALSACLFDIEAELQCSICCSLVSNAAATPCGHIFCE